MLDSVSEISRTYTCMISPPRVIAWMIFVGQATGNVEYKSVQDTAVGGGGGWIQPLKYPPPHNGKAPSNQAMGCLALCRQRKKTHTYENVGKIQWKERSLMKCTMNMKSLNRWRRPNLHVLWFNWENFHQQTNKLATGKTYYALGKIYKQQVGTSN